jgi:Golgi phosphoprotein 3
MASAGGLTRRRGGGRVAGGDDNDDSRVSSPISRNGSALDHRGPEASFTSSENGHKIAFDPRDLSESEERSKQPKLTLMEEVLLLGLKDKQVSAGLKILPRSSMSRLCALTRHC